METRLDTTNDQMVISLTNSECMAVARGEMVSDRDNPFDPDAKVEVAPYSQLDPFYEPCDFMKSRESYMDALSKVACRAIILNNNDVRVFVPYELAGYNMITAETIDPKRIDGDDEVIPRGGIRVEFTSK